MDTDQILQICMLVAVILALGAAAATLDSGQFPTLWQSGDQPTVPSDPPNRGSPIPRELPESDINEFTFWTPPSWLIIGVFIISLGGVFAYLFIQTGIYNSVGAVENGAEDEVDLNQIGTAAGEAADRIETSADVSNGVYHAWRQMVQQLDVAEFDTTTPEEFETYAIEAGMNPDDVAKLTQLFAEVRYGERDPADRETRAIRTLRRIETAYADEYEPNTPDGRDVQ